MNTIHAIVIAVLQGATELFPVSSLGHAVVLPALLHWQLDEHAPEFLPFLVMLHVGTAIALLGYFWRDWWALATGVLGLGSPHQVSESRRVFVLIVIATIPAVILGFLLEHFFRSLFGTPLVAAAFLMVNGGMLLVGRAVARPGATGRCPRLTALRRAGDRLLPVRRADPGDFPLRRHHRRRTAARHRP